MFRFLELEPKSFGLDISDLSLKLAFLEKKGKFFSLKCWGERKIKQGIIEAGEIKQEIKFIKEVEKLQESVKGKGLNTKNVIVSLPEKKSFLQIIKMPPMDSAELKTSVFFEAENHIPLPLEKVYLDYQLVSVDKDGKMNILIVVTPKKIVDSYLSCFKKAGLIVRAMEVESQSIVRSLIKKEYSEKPILIVDFGETTTSFIIFQKNYIVFTSSIEVSSGLLTKEIAAVLGVEPKEAEKMKIEYGLKGSKKEGREVSKIIKPDLIDLKDQINKYLNFYQKNNKNQDIEKIFLCGRGSFLKGLTEFLSTELKIPTSIASPWVNILPEPLKEVPGLPYKESLGYTTALGLAIRGAKKND